MKQNIFFNKIAKEIRRTRREKNMTQDDLAKSAKITKASISSYEKGKKEPKITTFLKIWKAIGKKITDLDNLLNSNF